MKKLFHLLNLILIPLCLFTLLMGPGVGVANNPQLNRLLVVCCFLLLVTKLHSFKMDVHHWLFLGWMFWAAIGTFFAENQAHAFYGFYPYRGDGLLTWLIIVTIAFAYWFTFKTLKPLAFTCILMIVAVSVGYCLLVIRSHNVYARAFFNRFFLPDTGLGSFACQAAPVMALFHPLLPVLGLAPILAAASRGAFIAWLLTWNGIALAFWDKKKAFRISVILFVLFNIGIFASPLILRALKIEPKFTDAHRVLWVGARPQWIAQAEFLTKRLPLTGFGLDNLQNELVAPTNVEFKDLGRFIPDRTHNLIFDLILMTGWLGYALILLCFGWAIAVAVKYPTKHNLICLSAVVSYAIFSMFNPNGALGHAMAVISLFGIRRES